MTPREIIGRLLAWRRRRDMERELAAELEAHVELLARDLAHEGMPADEARDEARRRVGNLTSLGERSRDAWGFPALDALVQDIRYAVRGLVHAPGFTVTVVVTLALGIGANIAMFGVIDRLMFRPFPFLRSPGDVHRVYLESTYRGHRGTNTVFPYRRYLDLREARGPITDFAAVTEWRFAVGTGDASRVVKVAGVTSSFFGFFDAPPILGRYFFADEDQPPSGRRVAVISHDMWTRELHRADVVGRPLKVGMLDYTIVGVAPGRFVGTVVGTPPDVFVPITTIPANLGPWSEQSYLRDYSWDWTEVLIRRKPGADLIAVSAALTEAYVGSRAAARAINPRVLPDSLVRPRAIAGPVKTAAGPDAGREARVLLWVQGVAAIVLLIACANVVNLMLARVIRRRREIAVRLALGVSRARLLGQFGVEGLVLALAGAAAGVAVAQWGGVAIRRLLLPQGSPFNLVDDWRTLTFALACAVGAALLTTIGPAIMAARGNLAASLKAGTREGTFHRSRARTTLLVTQAALTSLLLVGAGLFVRSFANARAVPLGYDARPVLEAIADFRGHEMDSATSVATRRQLLAAAKALPGVEHAARVNSRLFGTNTAELRIAGIDSVEALGRFNFQIASPEYFEVMRIPILRGRALTNADRENAPLVAVVSQAMAEALWPGRDPLGQCMRVGLGARPRIEAPCISVVGVAGNTAQQNISDDPRFMYYLPVDQVAPAELSTMLLRLSTTDVRGVMEGIRRQLTQAMPGDGFVVVRPLQEVVDDQSRSWRLGATLFVAFGSLALVVALVGLYGVVSYNVTQRKHELGVRVALGARAGDVIRLVVGQGFRVVAIGITVGLTLALAAARWVQPLLFRESARDPATYAVVGVAMLFAAVLASMMPARRAARADPNAALRSD